MEEQEMDIARTDHFHAL